MAGNPWMTHLASVWKSVKAKGGSYKQAMMQAKKSYKKGKASDDAPKKKFEGGEKRELQRR